MYIRSLFLCITTMILFLSNISYVNAVTCEPPFNGTYNVTRSCTYPSGNIRVYGNINLWGHTITVPSGVVLGIDLNTNRVDVNGGKIIFLWTGKMDNTVSSRNLLVISYSSNNTATQCPAGYAVLNTAGTAYQGWSVTNVGSSGTIRCGRDAPV